MTNLKGQHLCQVGIDGRRYYSANDADVVSTEKDILIAAQAEELREAREFVEVLYAVSDIDFLSAEFEQRVESFLAAHPEDSREGE